MHGVLARIERIRKKILFVLFILTTQQIRIFIEQNVGLLPFVSKGRQFSSRSSFIKELIYL